MISKVVVIKPPCEPCKGPVVLMLRCHERGIGVFLSLHSFCTSLTQNLQVYTRPGPQTFVQDMDTAVNKAKSRQSNCVLAMRPGWAGSDQENKERLMCINGRLSRNHSEQGAQALRGASWTSVNTFHTRRVWKQHAWGSHLHLDENGPPREEIKPFLTPSLSTSQPPVMCPLNGLWAYSTEAAHSTAINNVGQLTWNPNHHCAVTQQRRLLV